MFGFRLLRCVRFQGNIYIAAYLLQLGNFLPLCRCCPESDPDLLAEIEEWEKADHDEPVEYYFSNPDPYLKPQPLPPDHPRHNCYFNEDGHLCVKNLSAFWLPEFTLQKEIGGTVYTVTGSYDGVETLDRKMERVMGEKFTEKMEDSE